MPSSQTLYNVTITNGNTNGAPGDGFIDNLKIEDYAVSLASQPAGLTVALSKAKRRANFRYIDIIGNLSMVSNMYVVDNAITSDATYKTEATAFSFKLIIEHGDASLVTEDENAPGTYLTGNACIVRCVARALVKDRVRPADWFDPTNSLSIGTYGASTSVIRYGTRVWPGGTTGNTFEIGAYATSLAAAEALIVATPVVF